jgi:hypothetical protein
MGRTPPAGSGFFFGDLAMNGYQLVRPAVFVFFSGCALFGLFPTAASQADEKDSVEALRKALTFAASFDAGLDADFARGDRKIYHASSVERKDPKPGLPAGEMEIAKGQGRHGGDALSFAKKSSKVAFYKALGNVDYHKENWSGTVSFWLNFDPRTDLGDWYCDPIQITEKAWNHAALWVDFSKDERPKLFRLGAFADMKVWNPDNRDYEKMSPAERPMVTAKEATFARGKWTHVAIAFEKFNTGRADGRAILYVDGKAQGEVSGRNQQFHWDLEKSAIQIGIAYVGLFDDLAIFDRALSATEIQALHQFKGRLVETK